LVMDSRSRWVGGAVPVERRDADWPSHGEEMGAALMLSRSISDAAQAESRLLLGAGRNMGWRVMMAQAAILYRQAGRADLAVQIASAAGMSEAAEAALGDLSSSSDPEMLIRWVLPPHAGRAAAVVHSRCEMGCPGCSGGWQPSPPHDDAVR
jgi:hypothetical protein